MDALDALEPTPDWVRDTCPPWCFQSHKSWEDPLGVHEHVFDDPRVPGHGVSVAVQIDAHGKVVAFAGATCESELVDFPDEPAIIAGLWTQAAEFLREIGLN
jgi:hypothetical protein